MKHSSKILIAIFILSTNMLWAQESKPLEPSILDTMVIELPNGKKAELVDGKNQTLFLITDRKVKGKIILFKDKFAVADFESLVVNPQEMDSIETSGLKFGRNKIKSKYLTVVNDSIILVAAKFHSYDEIKAIGWKGSRGSTTFKRFYVSFGVMGSFLNPSNALYSQMNSSGMNESDYEGLRISLNFLPELLEEFSDPTLDLDFRYYFNSSQGVLFNYSRNDYRVSGFKQLGVSHSSFLSTRYYGYRLNLELINNYFSLVYSYSLLNQRANFMIGPALLSNKVTHTITGSLDDSKNELRQNKIGFFIGSSFNLVQKRFWFLNVKVHYNWFQKVSVGPYTVSGMHQEGYERTSTFEQIDVSMNSFNIGAGIGLRL